ncbi:MAG: cytochrome C554 [Planctomycetes bacterium]|nr:cytochrome C554 [Planctomycetota bacterium]
MRLPFGTALCGLAVTGLLGWLHSEVKAEPEKPAHNYVGVDKCKVCHKSEAKGNQHGKWLESKHSKAYATLASEESKKVAKEKGIADPQKAPECLRCHTTAFGVAAEALGEKFKVEEGVQCEACHGPGADYQKKEIMKDVEKAKAAGMTLPDEKVCTKCHNKDSPFYKEFDFKKFAEKIAHPNPNKGKGGDETE